jgi:four helix bundle protein
MLDYEKLDVYRCSIEHLAFVFKALAALPKGFSSLGDQWRRAATSIPLNIAEAVGKPSRADRMNRFAIARGEAMECGAILDVVRLLDVLPAHETDAARTLVVRTVEMLTRLCRS